MTGDPDETWHKFLQDNEDAIRRTAPREPSAWERAEGTCLPETNAPSADHPSGFEAVGETWALESADPVPWRDLDAPGRMRRAASAAGVLAVLVAFLVTVCRLPVEAEREPRRPIGVASQPPQEPASLPATEFE
ncbi:MULTISPECIES: hypothetical protein [unclassified Streptomyces]|uniref:hypothetical protein n=1 Tax=unclassified Streptomyces TaxID=2593676 RepID=UPI002ED66A3B|nr:hypothetical protein OH827_17785 [Streptomyces sp. NBC_00891]WSY06741.1 hypothetical protein OG464_17785 [Streptomyces sp. NBC_00890]WSZ08366.1 hypothetical protein OG704_17785 [Streptomyces sp. NBC_00869]WSZ24136.1 hypothetical protein OG498_15780 [Streptomyces sp. NBC_00870]